MSKAKACVQGIMPGKAEQRHHYCTTSWEEPRRCLKNLPSQSLFVRSKHFSGRVSWGFLWSWQEENSLLVKEPFKTKRSIGSRSAASFCAFFEVPIDLRAGASDLPCLGAPSVSSPLWLPLMVFAGACSPYREIWSSAGSSVSSLEMH